MSTIHKQLVTDEEGRPVGVLIPYEEWLHRATVGGRSWRQ